MATSKKPAPKQITAWSFSRYTDHTQCPLKAKLKHIDKIQEPKNDAMARGGEIHTLAEHYIKGIIVRLPKELKLFAAEFKKLKAQYKKAPESIIVEDNWAFTSTWAESRWNDWVNCWLRVKLDCAHQENSTTLIITDWKTGKYRDNLNQVYIEQLDLYALSALILMPHIEIVKPRLVYLDYEIIYPSVKDELIYTRADIPRLKKEWNKRTRAMLVDKAFPPKPNNLCSWCFFRSSNKANGGGQCKF